MNYQAILATQIIVSSLMTLWVRRTAINNRKYALNVALITYLCVFIMGIILSLLYFKSLPNIPTVKVWFYLLIEGIAIPVAWLMQFLIISYIGASNAVVVGTINVLGTALLGILLLNEPITISFYIGAILIFTGIYISLVIKPDTKTLNNAPKSKILTLMAIGLVAFSLGIFFEKLAIEQIGPWNYAMFGWGMQFIGASLIYRFYSNHKMKKLPKKVKTNAIVLGLLTSMVGFLFVLALSIGTLSQTIVATSGKLAVTSIIAAIFLNERNNILLRTIAFLFSVAGIYLVIMM